MNHQEILIAYWTIVRKESIRIFRIWTQTLLPPVITTSLYFVIFGAFIGSQIQPIEGVPYMQFIVPGLVMMSVITNSFANVVGSFFGSKFQRNIEEIIVSPTPPWVVIAGFVTGGVIRGLSVGVSVLLVSMFFADLQIIHPVTVLAFIFLTAILFSLAGLLNGLYATSFDATVIVPTFVLTPLTYLGGIFYSVSMLPDFWQTVSQFNPVLYMVNGFRYGFLGFTDVSLLLSFWILLLTSVVFLIWNIRLFHRRYGLQI